MDMDGMAPTLPNNLIPFNLSLFHQPDHAEALAQVEEARQMAHKQKMLGPGVRLEVRKARKDG